MKDSSKQVNSTGNKIIISSLHLLFPTTEKLFNLNIVINEGKPLKGKTLEFKGNSNSCVIGQSFLFEHSMDSLETICFQVYDGKIKDTKAPLFKGEVKGASHIKDPHSQNLICYLKTSNNEDFAVIYYNFEFKEDDLFQKFVKDKKAQEVKNELSVLEYSVASENESYRLLIHNYNYMTLLIDIKNDIINWNSYKMNIGLLLVMSMMIISFNVFSFVALPLGAIAYHLIYKHNIDKSQLIKSEAIDSETNTQLLLTTMSLFNKAIQIFEDFIIKLAKCEKRFIEGIYINLLKTVCVAFILVYVPIWYIIPVKLISLVILWSFLLSYNHKCYSVYLRISNLIKSKQRLFDSHFNWFKRIRQFLHEGLFILTPFLDMAYLKEEVNEKPPKPNVSSSSLNKGTSSVKIYELYENERWWVGLGWAKQMIMGECSLWCSTTDSKTFCDMTMISLPEANEYKWVCEWKVEKHDKTDKDGWEYGDNFNSEFNEVTDKKYVRRRKWVRYAALISKP